MCAELCRLEQENGSESYYLCSSDKSNHTLESAFQACTYEAAIRTPAEWLKAQAKDSHRKPTTAIQLFERRLENVDKGIDYTDGGMRGTAPSGIVSSLKIQIQA